MDELIVASLQGSTSQAEEEALRQWRGQAPSNEERYHTLVRIWAATARGDLADALSRPSASSIIRAASERASATLPGVPFWRRSSVWMRVGGSVALAASFVGGILAAELLFDRPPFEASEITASPGGMMTLSLSDGSVVRAAPGSSLHLEASPTERVVRLEGRAFFAVARQDHQAFVVRTEVGEVVVHGTRFQVTSEAEGLEVLVVEGEVAVKAGDDQRAVTGGQLAQVQAGSAVSVADVDQVQERLSWMGNFLVFRDTELRNALREVEARYGVPISVRDSAPMERSITATFLHDESFRSVMDVICQATAMKCVVTDTLAVIQGSR